MRNKAERKPLYETIDSVKSFYKDAPEKQQRLIAELGRLIMIMLDSEDRNEKQDFYVGLFSLCVSATVKFQLERLDLEWVIRKYREFLKSDFYIDNQRRQDTERLWFTTEMNWFFLESIEKELRELK